MNKPPENDKIIEAFIDYLLQKGVNKANIKHYKSDIRYFSGYLKKNLTTFGVEPRNMAELIPFFSRDTGENFHSHIKLSGLSKKTINRRLSTLRHFGRFLHDKEVLRFNFAANLKNLPLGSNSSSSDPDYVIEFEKHLKGSKVSDNTIKSYLSDVKQFLSWIDSQNIN